MKRALLIFGIAGFLASCATGYQPEGFTGGFTETRLSENVYRVNVSGNGFTSEERAYNMAMLRSAELTIQSGYNYFLFADTSSKTESSIWYNPPTSTTSFNANVTGNFVTGSATTTTSGGGYTVIEKPSTTNIVVMFVQKPEGVPFSYDARLICGSLGPQYKVSCFGAASPSFAAGPGAVSQVQAVAPLPGSGGPLTVSAPPPAPNMDRPATANNSVGPPKRPAKTQSGYCYDVPRGYAGTGSLSKPALSSATPACYELSGM